MLSANYELDREIGRGGMGIVYLARDRRLKRQVAIKILPPELAFRGEIRTRFLREAETAAQLSHPNIVPIYSVDEREGLVFFVMAYVDGDNLAVRLHKNGALAYDETRRTLLEVARALAFAHERGVVHRDIKPDNILINKEDGRVMVTDFGIARAVSDSDARLTATGMAIGTPAYMSPEQSMGEREVDGRSDLYSLGVVAYQMISGELPFNASSTPALLVKHISENPVPLHQRCPEVPQDLGRAVMMMLEKDPDNRFPSAAALATALETGEVPMPRNGGALALGSVAPRSATEASSLRPGAGAMAPAYGAAPSSEELARWNAHEVRAFRKKLAPWMFAGGVSVVVAAFGGPDFAGLWGMYSIYIAWKYAKLWSDGYDWRDILKEPKDRLFFDVVAEWTDSVRALWDPTKRGEVRDRMRARSSIGGDFFDRAGSAGALGAGAPVNAVASLGGASGRSVQDARRNRDEILRLIETLPKKEKSILGDVPSSAMALYQKVEALALQVQELERTVPAESSAQLDAEIARLEGEANPLDTRASEERVRRLAYLKRQRRAVADLGGRLSQSREKLESCMLALQNMRLEVVRLRSGPQNFQTITSVAEKAIALGREVDAAVYARDEMAKLKIGGRG
ncbi:MAG: serine/threonine protein kinase [Gemmatimonadetes bacterium]|nr:serine/threonine protein kinase [Gemmatimonadota bacterium]